MQGVTLPKAPSSPPLPVGVSGPQRRDLAEGLRPVTPRAGAVPAAWSNHGRHHRSLCREGSAGLPGAVGRQMGRGLRTAARGAPAAGASRWRGEGIHRSSVGLHRDKRWPWVAVTLLCPERGWGGTGGTPQLSPGLASSCPSPPLPGSRSWWYFSCLARIRSILPGRGCCGACSPQPPGGTPSHPPTQGCPKVLVAAERVPRYPPKPTHCRFSWANDFFSACRWECMLFRTLALNSATPLQGQREGEGGHPHTPAPTGTLQDLNPTWKPAGQRLGGPA